MNCFRNQFFSSSALTSYQNGRASRRDLLNQTKYFLHYVRSTNYFAAINCFTHRSAQRTTFLFLAPAFDSCSNGGSDLFVLKRLTNAAKSPALPGCDRGVKSRISSNHHNHCLWIHLQKLFQRSQSAYTRHRNVEQNHIESAPAIRFQALFSGFCQVDAITFCRQKCL